MYALMPVTRCCPISAAMVLSCASSGAERLVVERDEIAFQKPSPFMAPAAILLLVRIIFFE